MLAKSGGRRWRNKNKIDRLITKNNMMHAYNVGHKAKK